MIRKLATGPLAASALILAACGDASLYDADLDINVCERVTEADLDIIAAAQRSKVVHATGGTNRCMWAESEGAMAYLDIAVAISDRNVRAFFSENFPDHVQLVEIRDLGDGGYMTVTEGRIGNVAIRKGNRVLTSAAVFLDIEPGSAAHDRLREVYRRILD